MTEKERVLQTGDDSNFRRLGVDGNDLEFRKDYFRYRDLLSVFVGNGNLPTATIMEIALRHPKVKPEPEEVEAEVPVKKRLGRPPKKKESALA